MMARTSYWWGMTRLWYRAGYAMTTDTLLLSLAGTGQLNIISIVLRTLFVPFLRHNIATLQQDNGRARLSMNFLSYFTFLY